MKTVIIEVKDDLVQAVQVSEGVTLILRYLPSGKSPSWPGPIEKPITINDCTHVGATR